MLCKEFDDKIVDEIVSILGHYNAYKKYNLRLSKLKTKDAISEEAGKVSQQEYVPCLKAIYKKLSSIIYSHHCMARFHNEYNPKTAPKHLRPLSRSENEALKVLMLEHRKPIWDMVQAKIIEILRATTNFFFNLSVRELYDVLALTNIFIEVGIEFVKPKNSLLLDEVLSLSNRYMIDFKESNFSNLKELINTEEWQRLPLPDNYEVKEFNVLLSDYPPNFKSNIKIFTNHYSGRLNEYPPSNVFSQFIDGNPFDSSQLMNESKVDSPDKVILQSIT
jgi:hypothetical protein